MFDISSLAQKINGAIEGNPDLIINGVGDLKNSPEGFLSFLSEFMCLFTNNKEFESSKTSGLKIR